MTSEKNQREVTTRVILRFVFIFVGNSIIYGLAGINLLLGPIKNFIFMDASETTTFLTIVLAPHLLFLDLLPTVIVLSYLSFRLYQIFNSTHLYDDNILISAKKYGKYATFMYFISWFLFGVTEIFQYQLSTGTSLHVTQSLMVVVTYTIFGVLVAISAYLSWEHFGIDWIISLRHDTSLGIPVGMSFRWKLILIMYVIPIAATLLIAQLVTANIVGLGLTLSTVDVDSLNEVRIVNVMAIVVIWVPIIITTIPILWSEIQNVNKLAKSFETLKFQRQDDFTLTILPITTTSDFGKIVSDYNQFITQLHARILFSLDSAHQLESFFNDLNEQIEQLVRAQEDIAKSMELTTSGVQHQSETLQEMTSVLSDVRRTFALLHDHASQISQNIARLTTQIQIVSLNARIEAARGEGGNVATITFIARRITQLSQEVKQLQEQLQEQFRMRLHEFGQKFEEVIERINKVQEVAQDNAASSEEVSASVEEATATLHTTREEARNLSEQLSHLIRELQLYSTIKHLE